MNIKNTTDRFSVRHNSAAAAAARSALRAARPFPPSPRVAGAFWDADQPFYVNLIRPSGRLAPSRFNFPLPGQNPPP